MWGVATHKEDLTPEQIGERRKKQMQAQPKPTTGVVDGARAGSIGLVRVA